MNDLLLWPIKALLIAIDLAVSYSSGFRWNSLKKAAVTAVRLRNRLTYLFLSSSL